MQVRANELSTEIWSRVFKEAAEAGALQADLTGGEPLARTDVVDLIRAARASSLYVNLITSGLPMDEANSGARRSGPGPHPTQFSGSARGHRNEISGTKSTLIAARPRMGKTPPNRTYAEFCHSPRNIDQLEEMIALAESSSATRIEFANVQYYGWAFGQSRKPHAHSRTGERFSGVHETRAGKIAGKNRVEFVVPITTRVSQALHGRLGQKLMLITPSGDVLPCHAAQSPASPSKT